MIYILGMSQIACVLEATQATNLDLLNNHLRGVEPAFIDIDIKPGIFPSNIKAACIHKPNTDPKWGPTLALQTEPTVINIAPGFQRMLWSIEDSATNILFCFLYGEEHLMLASIHNKAFDFYLPWRPDLSILPQRQVIPMEVVERYVSFRLTRVKAVFTAIRNCQPKLRIVNVICPPPSPKELLNDNSYVPGSSYIPDSFRNDSVRLKHYLLYVKGLSESIKSMLNIESLMPPLDCIDHKGMLKSEFVADMNHGNKLYGEKVLAQMRDLLQTEVN